MTINCNYGGATVRRALSLAAILVLTLGTAGCGQGSEAEKGDTGTTEETTSGGASSASGTTSGSASGGSASGGASASASQATAPEADIQSTPELEAAVDEYRAYVVDQTDQLVEGTALFTGAVIAGNVEEAKETYAPARVHWERIEPIAAALGDLDPNIDAREGDVPDDEWRGFHRIEQALWVENTTEGQEEYARQLQADVEQLQEEVQNLELQPADLVTGSIELLNEVSAGKITGEEERYSRTDLHDIQANVEGSEAAFEALRQSLEQRDPELVAEIEERFAAVYETLAPYRQGDGWVPYTEVTENERRQISQSIDALAEPLSRIGQVLEA
jgi:iron uptake system component EfeO